MHLSGRLWRDTRETWHSATPVALSESACLFKVAVPCPLKRVPPAACEKCQYCLVVRCSTVDLSNW